MADKLTACGVISRTCDRQTIVRLEQTTAALIGYCLRQEQSHTTGPAVDLFANRYLVFKMVDRKQVCQLRLVLKIEGISGAI
ncbi:MAG: hypothetical protein ABF290_15250 [Thiogranum sp.]